MCVIYKTVKSLFVYLKLKYYCMSTLLQLKINNKIDKF